MSADLLREAAALMRERAEATDPSGAWEVGARYPRGADWMRPVYDDDGTVCEIHEGDVSEAPGSCEALAAHIASWHPAVALDVADWLEGEAARVDECTASRKEFLERLPDLAAEGWTASEANPSQHALRVAAAYLGRPTP